MKMKRTSILLIAATLLSCSSPGGIVKDDSGTFRGNWYNYYGRGVSYSDSAEWEDAISSFKSAVSRRSKDQRMARTYGMHFIDYFPHRELGIVYFNKGEISKAISELEESLKDVESSKAIYYLNKARKAGLLMQDLKPGPPSITVWSPLKDTAVNSFKIKVTGKAAGDGYISKLFVNNTEYRIGLAKKEMEFTQEISVPDDTEQIEVVSEDLLGNVSVQTVAITVDREGPSISIFDVIKEMSKGKEVVRITGEVNDSTGISRLMINDKAVVTDGKKTHYFDFPADSATVVIEAYDKLDNITKAEVDIDRELSAANIKSAPVLLVFSAADMFSSDDRPPVITLKDTEAVPTVFADKYYVEGEVSDNKKVEEIIVNGRDIFSKKGRKIFFSKLVKLNEGGNNIKVEAMDTSGNRSEAGFGVTRKIPEVLQVGSRMSISILPFENGNKDIPAGLSAYEHLTGSFVNQKRFNVTERARLEQVMLEQNLTREKLTDPEYSIKVGRLMAAETILATSVIADSRSVEFTSKVINTETSEIMEVKDVYSEDSSPDSIVQLMDGLALKVAGAFPLVEGIVIKKDQKFVFTDLGTGKGIKGDMGIIVYRKGKEIRHPLTGKSLGYDMENLGTADIEEIHEDFSKARLSGRKSPDNIRAQDMVITR
ncbi:MAG: hypothetical protein HZB61_03755 [Nitrospirae bacterium]|nr:hypothetical protein [Nitrospirota bacterium]